MKYTQLPQVWQRIFELVWQSLCKGSKAIAAVIVNEQEEIISEGRNRICEDGIPNPVVVHAETEAIRNLDINTNPGEEFRRYFC